VSFLLDLGVPPHIVRDIEELRELSWPHVVTFDESAQTWRPATEAGRPFMQERATAMDAIFPAEH
jgi:hypothetical protein